MVLRASLAEYKKKKPQKHENVTNIIKTKHKKINGWT